MGEIKVSQSLAANSRLVKEIEECGYEDFESQSLTANSRRKGKRES